MVANGGLDRVEETSPNTTRTWTYTEAVPIPPYCMIIAVGDFAQLEPPAREVTPLSYYVPQPDRAFAMQGFAPANPSLKFFTSNHRALSLRETRVDSWRHSLWRHGKLQRHRFLQHACLIQGQEDR